MTIANGHLKEAAVATRTIAITEVKANLLTLVTEIGETGDEIVIARRRREVARLTAAGPFAELRGWPPRRRPVGALVGRRRGE